MDEDDFYGSELRARATIAALPRVSGGSCAHGGLAMPTIVLDAELSHHDVFWTNGTSDVVRMTVGEDRFFAHECHCESWVPATASDSPTYPQCERQNVGYHTAPMEGANSRKGGTDAVVMACPANLTAQHAGRRRWQKAPRGVAACVPPVYTVPAPLGNATATKMQVADFMQHHRAAGITHFFIYTCDADIAAEATLQAPDTTVLLTTFCATTNMTMRAQNWMINDCIHRSAAAGLEWVLSCDIDERLAFKQGSSLRQLLDEYPTADALTLGSVLRWRHPDGTVAGTRTHCQTRGSDPATCTGYYGHRKHLTRAHRLFAANLHFILSGTWVRRCRRGMTRDRCEIHDLHASDAWLYHETASPHYSLTAWMDQLHTYQSDSRSRTHRPTDST